MVNKSLREYIYTMSHESSVTTVLGNSKLKLTNACMCVCGRVVEFNNDDKIIKESVSIYEAVSSGVCL